MRPSDKEAYRTLLVEWNDRAAWIWARYYVAAAARIRERLLDVAEVKPGDSVLDVGTATGSAAIAAARRVGETGRVVGIDTSPKMVKKARESAAESGLLTLEFHLMDSASLEFVDSSVDGVTSCFGQPETPWDVPTALQEWRRVLVPGGRFCHCVEADLEDERFFAMVPQVCGNHRVGNLAIGLTAT